MKNLEILAQCVGLSHPNNKQLQYLELDVAVLRKTYYDALVLRFGLKDGQLRSLQQAADEIHRARQRMSQIEGKAIEKLRALESARGVQLNPQSELRVNKHKHRLVNGGEPKVLWQEN